ncbi:MAG: GNAT family N-acetyltransferase [Prevotella sp.]|nr:GNAT family N-acetyltransferase [Alistipes senegalensis]MCM1358662.1 GNAT family N-acetyltransferase [Prevotella sp.]MCM1474211.1 GNAT family N-acetyltransferase [Muribaculaceae bacterium]
MQTEIKFTSYSETDTAYTLTRELMEYHNALDIFTMTPERFRELVKSGVLISFIAYVDGEPVGVMNAFYKYTTFSGRKIFYIEDLYTRESFRGYGIGGKLLEKAKETAVSNDCGQIELKCASWNKRSAGFYESHGMNHDTDWNVYILNI